MLGWTAFEDGTAYSDNRDVFHPPRISHEGRCATKSSRKFAESISSTAANDRTPYDGQQTVYPEAHINSLPPELLHSIFRLLSIPALDAARLVSKAWHHEILNGSYFLKCALALETATPHSELLTCFDEATTLAATRGHPDCWRARYRQHLIHFLSAERNDSDEADVSGSIQTESSTTKGIRSAIYFSKHDLFFVETISYHVIQDSDSSTDLIARNLNLYRLVTNNTVDFVGQLELPLSEGSVGINDILELDSGSRWRVSIEASQNLVYDIAVRRGWRGGDNPYEVKLVDPAMREVYFKSGPKAEALPELGSFRLISQLPPVRTAFDDISANIVRSWPREDQQGADGRPLYEDSAPDAMIMGNTDSFYIAQRPASDELILLRYNPPRNQSSEAEIHMSDVLWEWEQPACKEPYCSVLGTFSPPCDGEYLFRNIAVASTIVRNVALVPVLRVAVIWQHVHEQNPTYNLLYLYEVPWYLANKVPSQFSTLRGKRISSLPPHFGGIHSQSGVPRTLSSGAADTHDTIDIAALGGINFPPRPTARDDWTNQWSKLHIWGPSLSHHALDSHSQTCTGLEFHVYDFSFMTPERLGACDVPPTREPEDDTTSLQRKPRRMMMSRRIDNCCCTLHDEVWKVKLPNMHPLLAASSSPPAATQSRRSYLPNFLLTKETPKPLSQAEVKKKHEGTIARERSLAQLAAEARQEEWFRRKIVGMRAAGKTDYEIEAIWKRGHWSRFGVVPKPSGWRTEWRAWAAEFGVAVPAEEKEGVIARWFRPTINYRVLEPPGGR